jgi:DNA-binding NarL/FixJ family response regulator
MMIDQEHTRSDPSTDLSTPTVKKEGASIMAENSRLRHESPGLVWIDCSPSVTSLGLEHILNKHARVHVGRERPRDTPACIILCAEDTAVLSEKIEHTRESSPDIPILVVGTNEDLELACDSFRSEASGFIHAQMTARQLVRAVTVATKGELVAPRRLIGYLLRSNNGPDLEVLSFRQRQILELVVEGLSNAEIAGRLHLAESTVKQHLRVAYKLLGVRSRTEAAKLIRDDT